MEMDGKTDKAKTKEETVLLPRLPSMCVFRYRSGAKMQLAGDMTSATIYERSGKVTELLHLKGCCENEFVLP